MSNSNETHIGAINIQTAATDSDGVARSIGAGIRKYIEKDGDIPSCGDTPPKLPSSENLIQRCRHNPRWASEEITRLRAKSEADAQ